MKQIFGFIRTNNYNQQELPQWYWSKPCLLYFGLIMLYYYCKLLCHLTAGKWVPMTLMSSRNVSEVSSQMLHIIVPHSLQVKKSRKSAFCYHCKLRQCPWEWTAGSNFEHKCYLKIRMFTTCLTVIILFLTNKRIMPIMTYWNIIIRRLN